MRMRIASLLALFLAVGTVFCSTAPTPSLSTCCLLTASDGTVDCYCGTAAQNGYVSSVVVSGSTCTVIFTNDGGVASDGAVTSDGGSFERLNGYPPGAITDCMNLVGH